MKLLLHSCCAPCSIQCVKALGEEGIKPDLYWYNPNIHPYTEFKARMESLKTFAADKMLPLICDELYGLRYFIARTSRLADTISAGAPRLKAGRCSLCYRSRLEQCAITAARMKYDAFSTTLLISIYQNHNEIFKLGNELAKTHGLDFIYRDFRPRFREGQKEARALSYHMQKYCGCIFSEEERWLGEAK